MFMSFRLKKKEEKDQFVQYKNGGSLLQGNSVEEIDCGLHSLIFSH